MIGVFRHGRRPSWAVIFLFLFSLGLPLIAATNGSGTNVRAALTGSSSSSSSSNDAGATTSPAPATTTPTPTPSPTFPADDCSPCCPDPAVNTSTVTAGLSCCNGDKQRSLYSTINGECSGLPCCTYRGRRSQNRQAWYPCLLFPTCRLDSTKRDFCEGNASWSFTAGSAFTCNDGCCSGPILESNHWLGIERAQPGQRNATFSIKFNPADYWDVFYPPTKNNDFTLQQLVLAAPRDFEFGPKTACRLTLGTTRVLQNNSTRCTVATFNATSHLVIDIPNQYRGREAFTVTFDHVQTPSGIDKRASKKSEQHSTASDLVPVYFLFNDPNGNVFSGFVRAPELEPASLTSGAFVPENIYPGNTGNASLSFYSNARIPAKSIIQIMFAAKWKFTEGATWSWKSFPETATLMMDKGVGLDSSKELEVSSSSSGEMIEELMAPRNFTNATYDSGNRWRLYVRDPIESGWIHLLVDRVQNPSVSYSGLNFASVEILDPKSRLIVSGSFSAISVETLSEPAVSPYNYVTMVVLIGTLMFCTVVIKSNGLSFSLGSIWTDLTAICTLLALITAIINNIVWTITRGPLYFYISRIFLCFTFTMLTAVCFHWGTVLHLHLRRLPRVKTVVAFVVVNLMFYFFQAIFLFMHKDLITRVYESEGDAESFANQQCKHGRGGGDEDLSNNVFSEIQGYLWSCYAENEDKFFLVSTTVTSSLFLALTLIVMALGLMVMRRGKLLVGNASGSHQLVLMKALRLYYTLIGVVTMVYLLSWIVQLASRNSKAIPYPWYYIFTVWLPYSIPPCCLIFLQWNSTAKSLKDADFDPATSTELSQAVYDEIRTPSCAFSTGEAWDLEVDDEDMDDDDSVVHDQTQSPHMRSLPENTLAAVGADDFIGLSMTLETNEAFPSGCFIAIQRMVFDNWTQTHVWRQIGTTDTVEAAKNNPGIHACPRHVYSFMSVPRIPVSSFDDRVRLVVYTVSSDSGHQVPLHHHSEMTAESVLATLDCRSSGPDQAICVEGGNARLTPTSFDDDIPTEFERSRVIDELFEEESEPDSTDVPASALPTLSIVAEFTVSTDVLVTSGARSELVVLVAAEQSYKQMGLESTPPKLSVHTVLPKAARAKYGLAGVATGMVVSHSISSQYHIREQGLLVVEDLTESRFSNSIPRQILEIMIRYRGKQLLVAQSDLIRLDAFDRQRQKGCDRGIYENLIQQIQDDGDVSRCRDWMMQRCESMREYIRSLRRLRRKYMNRDSRKEFFKPSTEKKNRDLCFLPINLHLQEMWVGSATASFEGEENAPSVYDIVTVGAMAAHVYKFKSGGILGLEEQLIKMKSRRREPFGSVAAHYQSPLWTEDEQKAYNLEWDIQKRMDVCFSQAVATLVTAFTRKVDLALQCTQSNVGAHMLLQLEKLGFLFDVESLVSTHGNEAGMLEDMAGAVNELRNVRFVLVDEVEQANHSRDFALSFDVDEEMKSEEADGNLSGSSSSSSSTSSANASVLSGVVDVNVFSSMEEALAADREEKDVGTPMLAPPSPAHSVSTMSSSFTAVGHRLINTFIKAKSNKLLGKSNSSAGSKTLERLFGYTHLVIRVKVRTSGVKLPESLSTGGFIAVYPVLFSQGINEKQTLANNTGSSVTRLQDVINENSFRQLRSYCDRYCNYLSSVRSRGTCPSLSSSAMTRAEVNQVLNKLEKLMDSSRQTRKKRPEILQLSSDLCRRIGGGRVTVCKSAKDRTGMSVTLEQGRILVHHHGLPESRRAGIVAVMRSQGVRIENALKNTGRRVFAFNALQRSLLPEEYRCPPQTAGKNVS